MYTHETSISSPLSAPCSKPWALLAHVHRGAVWEHILEPTQIHPFTCKQHTYLVLPRTINERVRVCAR
eukprot:6383725-Amphidinium_carterae.1